MQILQREEHLIALAHLGSKEPKPLPGLLQRIPGGVTFACTHLLDVAPEHLLLQGVGGVWQRRQRRISGRHQEEVEPERGRSQLA